MSINETRELIAMLRAMGVTHYKSDGLELVLGDLPSDHTNAAPVAAKQLPEALERALAKLPPGYRDARMFKFE
jgi:hypothetical protein